MIPKFRAWDKIEKEIFEVIDIDFRDKSVLLKCDWANFKRFEDIELLQSTGLFDKNGTEIFEGDIVGYEDMPPDVVKYHDGSFHYGLSEKQGSCPFCQDRARRLEIIGNRFENPELLESN